MDVRANVVVTAHPDAIVTVIDAITDVIHVVVEIYVIKIFKLTWLD
ncbi:hypothetical protein [Paenisporosarcina sp. TG-14]|nr:hypothetical protein [Paenisporosarcina sp. TG-14]